MKAIELLAAVLVCLACTQSRAAIDAFWDMDAATIEGKLPQNSGRQSGISTAFWDLKVGFDSQIKADVAGTTDNLPSSISPNSPNYGVDFENFVTVYSDGGFEMSGFDFSGRSDVGISFAYRSGSSFSWSANLDVDYNLNDGGGWTALNISDSYNNPSHWEVASIALPAAADESDVDLRIRIITWATGSSFLEVDNVQVTSVPEPSAFALGCAIAGLFCALARRRRRWHS